MKRCVNTAVVYHVSIHLLMFMRFTSSLNFVKQEMCRQELLILSSVKYNAVVYVSILVTGPFVIAQLSSINTSISSVVSCGHALA